MDTIKLTKEEIDQFKSLQVKHQELIERFGRIEMVLQQLINSKNKLIDELKENEKIENEMSKQFSTKYGNGDINLETGEFTPLK